MIRFALILLFIWHAAVAAAQPQNNHIIVGAGQVLDFNETPPVLQTVNTTTLNDRRGAAISDVSGNLLFYSDHQKVYMADGTEMPDGTFSQFCFESIILPDPSTAQRYYLIRSKLNSGLDYSIIDMSLNDGNGAFVEGQKEVFLAAQGGRLMSAGKENQPGHWLISVDNAGGSNNCWVRTYNLDEDGLVFHAQNSATWTWVGWFNEMDDARISPDCSVIAVTFKGHYFGLFQYDTTIGNTTASLQGSFDNLSGFSTRSRLEFSPNSELLYTTNDNVGITQFNITSFNANTIGNTSFTVLNCGFSQECAYDLKLAPNGKIYIVNNALNTLAVINQPDATGSACEYESNALAYQGAVGSMFARTVNLNCISVFFQPDVIEVCLGEPTEFSLSGSTNADSVLWDFGDPNASEAENQSTEFNPSHTYSEAGEYTVTVEVTSVLGVETFELTAIVYVVPNPTLDPEYTLCAGESLVLSGGEAESYLWNTGATTSDITVTAGGAYSVTATNAICSGEASTVVVFIEPPAFSLGADQYICDDQPVTLSAPFDVLWSTGETAESITVNATGEYTAEASNECFTTSASLLMVFVEEPDFGLAGRMTACEGDTINVSPSIHGADLVWTTPFGSQNGGSIAITESGDYTLTATLHGCPYTHDIETEFFGFVDVDAVILPNIFSPNNDGINDMYRPIFAANPSLNLCQLPVFTANLRIFNRWGNVVFEDGCAWNGRTESGNEISEGVYFYIVDYASTCLGRGGERQKTGTIDVVR